jgi:hypothetical protein
MLKAQSLPGFDHANWRSTIRKEVRVHPEYRLLEPWNGSETADIVYDDEERKLGDLLTQRGYSFDGLREG